MSRVEKILIALINGTSYDGPLLSRVEEILYSFLVDSTYDKPAESRVEDLLLALKNSSLYSDSVISRIEEILYCKLGNVEYTGPIGSRVEALLVQWELTKIIVITGVPPFTFNAKGTPLLDYTIYGNTIQSGTPTPDSPIEPEFVGDRTENLFDPENCVDGYILTNGSISNVNQHGKCTDYIDVSNHTVITLSQLRLDVQGEYYATIACWDENKQFIYGSRKIAWVHSEASSSIPFVTKMLEPNAKYIRASIMVNEPGDVPTSVQPMLNWGSEALPYEPYGYKIPISSAGQTKTIYLGQVQTTRRIKKLVLTGEESIRRYSTNIFFVKVSTTQAPLSNDNTCLSNEYKYATGGLYGLRTTDMSVQAWLSDSSSGRNVSVHDSNFDVADELKSYLAAQYAAGAPVIVWYVLATPETGIVNEPLAKIGDYADSVNFEQAGVEIPTTAGENTLSVGTTIQPSNMSIEVEEGHVPKKPVYITSDDKLYITSNDEVYILRR